MPGKRVSVKEATRSNVPSLLIGDCHAEFSALHRLEYKGPLCRWSNFLRVVEATDNVQNWSQRIIKIIPKSRDIEGETVEIGDEYGVQGRFQQSFGSLLGQILEAQSIDMHFADFKCLGIHYRNTPDVVLKNSNRELKVVGELKVPWVAEHQIGRHFVDELQLRTLLAQPIEYMQDLNCMYGFLSTYNETIFLRQQEINGRWEVDYSPVIDASTSYVRSTPTDLLSTPVVSVKQCFLYIVSLASQPGPVFSNTPKSQWIADRSRP